MAEKRSGEEKVGGEEEVGEEEKAGENRSCDIMCKGRARVGVTF